MFDPYKLRHDFPILNTKIQGKPLVYFDNAATTQKPKVVIDAISDFYLTSNANVHRGVHFLSQKATAAYEHSREIVRHFLSAGSEKEIIFTKGTTDSINLVASAYAETFLKSGDEILISALEHHANIVPWQRVCQKTGAVLRVIPISQTGEIIFDEFLSLLSNKTKFLAITHVSNALGTINPIKAMIQAAQAYGALVLVDGAQAIAHQPVNVSDLNCDFYAFSSHKLYGPTGVGVLYAKYPHLLKMSPYQLGGDMIREVSFESSTFALPPNKFEAGTPAMAEVIGLAAAIKYVSQIGLQTIANYEKQLCDYALSQLRRLPYIELIADPQDRAAIVSFLVNGAHAHDVGTILDAEGVAIRNGHHCAMPLMNWMGLAATSRASFAFYNTFEEVDIFIKALNQVVEIFCI